MIIVDENIPDNQCQLLKGKRIRVRKIGREISNKGIQDEDIIPLLHGIKNATFFTRDLDFFDQYLTHPKYCLVCLAIEKNKVAKFVLHFLRHSSFDTRAKRMGKVIRVSYNGISIWQFKTQKQQKINWDI